MQEVKARGKSKELQLFKELAKRHGGRVDPARPMLCVMDIEGIEWVAKGITAADNAPCLVRADFYVPSPERRSDVEAVAKKYDLEYQLGSTDATLYASLVTFDDLVAALKELGQMWRAK
jgi:hypothetical protein